MNFSLVEIWEKMDWMARCVVFALTALALGGLVVFFERLIAFAKTRKKSALFAEAAGPLIDKKEYKKAIEASKTFEEGHLAALIGPSLEMYVKHEGAGHGRGLDAVEMTKRELARRHEEVAADLRRGFSVLATVGSIAPFVGLLGTVVGIIAAFTKISTTGSGGLGSVAGGISEALVVTAFGLIVAIPAVLAFNMLSAKADALQLSLTTSAGQFMDAIEHQHSGATVSLPRSLKEESHGRRADTSAA